MSWKLKKKDKYKQTYITRNMNLEERQKIKKIVSTYHKGKN